MSNQITNEFKNKWFWIYLFSLVIVLIVFNLFKSNKFFNVSSLFFLALIQIIYGSYQFWLNKKSKFYQKYMSLLYGLYLGTFALINLAINFSEVIIALTILFSFFGILIITFTSILFKKLWESNSLKNLILFYILFSLSFNFMFAFSYTLTSTNLTDAIIDSNGKQIEGTLNYVLFSYSVYYGSVTEYFPRGISYLISIIQVSLSFILHIIGLGSIVKRKFI